MVIGIISNDMWFSGRELYEYGGKVLSLSPNLCERISQDATTMSNNRYQSTPRNGRKLLDRDPTSLHFIRPAASVSRGTQDSGNEPRVTAGHRPTQTSALSFPPRKDSWSRFPGRRNYRLPAKVSVSAFNSSNSEKRSSVSWTKLLHRVWTLIHPNWSKKSRRKSLPSD